MTDWDKILSQAEVPIAMRERKKTYTEKTTWRVALEKSNCNGLLFFVSILISNEFGKNPLFSIKS